MGKRVSSPDQLLSVPSAARGADRDMTTGPRIRIGRNDPCSCGSGKKYKHCCLASKVASIGPLRMPRPHLPVGKAPRISDAVTRLIKAHGQAEAWGMTEVGLTEIAETAKLLTARFAIPSKVRAKTPGVSDASWNYAVDLAMLQDSYGRRLAILYCDAIESINRRRLHLAALALRAIVELAGAIIYYERRVLKLLGSGIGSQEQRDRLEDLFRFALEGSRFRWNQFSVEEFLGLLGEYARASDHEHEPKPDRLQKSSAAFVAEVERQAAVRWPQRKGSVRLVYALLSDMCHPSLGGNVLLEEAQDEAGWVKYRHEPADEMLGFFVLFAALPVLVNVSAVALESLEKLAVEEQHLAH